MALLSSKMEDIVAKADKSKNMENISENMDIQHIINSWSINKENDDDYIETRKDGT